MSEEITDNRKDLVYYFRQASFAILMFLILISVFRLYFALENIIGTWFEYQYVPIFRAAYNLVVLLVSLYIVIHYFVRKQN
ncbi:hypothetical protein EFE42_05720 [Methanohalophilus sp. RSK]|uniref:hypothetical protein n=1 Tax=Methanohalophilus sp. RSK TaxID=2485783 RepID=UPI000F43C2EF|nr:hypothetical protein [Methanohalophilus sp. RSK]RNI14107.1 hypothetical protein EFE42_05720 [Methanohalophilus sp. RSK]